MSVKLPQAEREANPPGLDDGVGAWFSNPSGRSASQQVGPHDAELLSAAIATARRSVSSVSVLVCRRVFLFLELAAPPIIS